jgi:hypothetical protein
LIDKLDKLGWPHHVSVWKLFAASFEKLDRLDLIVGQNLTLLV